MKKLLGLLLAITMAWPIAANADVLKNTELKGEIQTIALDSHKLSPMYGSGTTFRVLAGLSTEIAEDVRANVLFHYSDGWNQNLDGSTVQYYWNNVTLAEANVVLSNLFCCLEATVGRQFYGDEDSAVMLNLFQHLPVVLWLFFSCRPPFVPALPKTHSSRRETHVPCTLNGLFSVGRKKRPS